MYLPERSSHARWLILLVWGLSILLSGCRGVNPVLDTLLSDQGSEPSLRLSPAFEYLRVSVGKHVTVVVLGERQEVATPEGLDVHEYWYSSQREMLHLVNGRLHRAMGFTTEWRSNQGSPPRWQVIQTARHEVPWSRELDVMPGYRYGQVDHLWIQPVPRPASAPREVATEAVWFEEAVLSKTKDAKPWAFQQRFAVRDGRVLYSEQCLAPDVCMTLRPLSLERRP
jgi:hypothetical protein